MRETSPRLLAVRSRIEPVQGSAGSLRANAVRREIPCLYQSPDSAGAGGKKDSQVANTRAEFQHLAVYPRRDAFGHPAIEPLSARHRDQHIRGGISMPGGLTKRSVRCS